MGEDKRKAGEKRAVRRAGGWSRSRNERMKRAPHTRLPRRARLNRPGADVKGQASQPHCTHICRHGTLTKYWQLGKYCGWQGVRGVCWSCKT